MLIDSSKLYALTKFTTTKGIPCVKRSDHYSMIATFNINWTENKPLREEVFKLRDSNGLEKFKQITSTSLSLLRCLESDIPLHEACERWYIKNLKNYYINVSKRFE